MIYDKAQRTKPGSVLSVVRSQVQGMSAGVNRIAGTMRPDSNVFTPHTSLLTLTIFHIFE